MTLGAGIGAGAAEGEEMFNALLVGGEDIVGIMTTVRNHMLTKDVVGVEVAVGAGSGIKEKQF